MRNDPDALMLFAAGFGTRMGDLTRNRPKPLIPVAGKALLDHALDLTAGITLSRIVVNAHYHSDQIEAHLTHRPDIAISIEIPDILETGGGLRHALPLLGAGPVLTLNTDAIWHGPNPLRALLAAWNPSEMDALLLTIPPKQALGHKGGSDFIPKNGRLSRGPGEIYTGAQIIKTELLHDIQQKAFSVNLLWDRMQANGRLHGITYSGQWCDVGRPESVALAEGLLQHV